MNIFKKKKINATIIDNTKDIIFNEYKKISELQDKKAKEFICLVRPAILSDSNWQEKEHYKQVEREFVLLSGQRQALENLLQKI